MNNTLTDTIQTVTLEASLVRDLFTGTSLMMADKDLTTLNGICLSVAGGKVIAKATDRFRLLSGETEISDDSAILDALIIPADSVKAILSAIKALPKRNVRVPEITFTRAGDVLTVALMAGESNTAFTVALNARGERDFPPTDSLFPAYPVAMDTFGFNPSYMADFGKVPAKGDRAHLIVTLHGSGKPMTVTIPHDSIKWHGLIMPMRVI